MLRCAVVLLALWATLPPALCQMACEGVEAPSHCERAAGSGEPEPNPHDECEGCETGIVATAKDGVDAHSYAVSFAALGAALQAPSPPPRFASTPRGPPGWGALAYRTTNRPLLS